MGDTLAFAVYAAVLTVVAWSVIGGRMEPRILIGLFGWHPISFSVFADVIIAFVIPLFVVGISHAISPTVMDAEPEEPDWEYLLWWGVAVVLAIAGYFIAFIAKSAQWVAPDNSAIVPIAGIVALGVAFLDRGYLRYSITAALVGFLATAYYVAGAIHGWIFPWAILAVWLIRHFIVSELQLRANSKATAAAHV